MSDYVTDTHALIWYLQDSPRLGPKARAAFDACDDGLTIVHIPTICLVEIVYLQEKGRIPSDLLTELEDELANGETGLLIEDLTAEIVHALKSAPRDKVPDMPDRIIAATAQSLGLPLLSRDKKIQLSDVETLGRVLLAKFLVCALSGGQDDQRFNTRTN